jgi:hypothetical protein
VRLIRSISEDEVIAEFLKSDFENQAFRRYRETLKTIVTAPDLSDPVENAKRRALLFLRHLTLWREIPEGTEWYEAEINEDDLESIRAFPRAQWRKLARGNFAMTEIAERLKSERHGLDVPFLAKIDSICDLLVREETKRTAVIMIGVNESEPLTVLDGNHRLTAAMLATPRTFAKLKFICGFSPRMRECCWYNTSLGTLFRYGKNRMGVALRDPEEELMRLLQQPEPL